MTFNWKNSLQHKHGICKNIFIFLVQLQLSVSLKLMFSLSDTQGAFKHNIFNMPELYPVWQNTCHGHGCGSRPQMQAKEGCRGENSKCTFNDHLGYSPNITQSSSEKNPVGSTQKMRNINQLDTSQEGLTNALTKKEGKLKLLKLKEVITAAENNRGASNWGK